MALSSSQAVVTATATGVSDHISLPSTVSGQDYVLHFSCADAFVLDVQIGDGTTFSDAYYDSTTQVTIDSSTGPQTVRVPGGQCYRMDVTTYNSDITMRARLA